MRSLWKRKQTAQQAEPNVDQAKVTDDLDLTDEDAGEVAGGVDMSPFTITKNLDKSSP
jgi:type VI protein secretion system component Hcp